MFHVFTRHSFVRSMAGSFLYSDQCLRGYRGQRQSKAAEYLARSSFTVDGRERDGMLGPVVRACFRYRFDTAHLRCAVRRRCRGERSGRGSSGHSNE
ncbi:hypothetical protein ACVWZL_008943 [Bradyrhizobium sp. GM2.4]